MKIIYIHCHDVGQYIEPYGHNVNTPNLMKFAQKTTMFGNAFSMSPTCSPSRGALLTGMSPHANGLYGLAHRGFKLNDYSKHLANYLKQFGFETVLSGQHHEARWQEMIGYDKCLIDQRFDEECHDNKLRDTLSADAAVKYIEENADKNYFLSVGFFCPHADYIESDLNADYIMPPPTMKNTRENREKYARFLSAASHMDSCVGKVLDAIYEHNDREDMYIMFTTDHGISFPEMKGTLYDAGTKVSLMIDYPDNPMRGKRIDALVSHLDVYPTICDIAGVPKPDWLEGTSMLPLFNGESDSIRDEVYTEMNYHSKYVPCRAVRNEKYKYFKTYDGYDNSFVKRPYPMEALFDLDKDPQERRNLVNDEKYKEVLDSMRLKLKTHMEKTNDPMLSGKIDAPEGVLLGNRDWSEFK